MKFAHRIAHLFWPRESNNQKAKLLHNSSLAMIAVCLIVFQGILAYLPKLAPDVLGYASNISPEEVIRLTNEKRVQNGLSPLAQNTTLSQAAQAKGNDMIADDYWAHFAPDGTSPWSFFANFGYSYKYAGENLARDFRDPSSAVEAWMNSPTHRENLLSSKYKEIGIAVVEGDLAGVDTTIIVQFFGTQASDTIPVQPIAQITPIATVAPENTPTPAVEIAETPIPTVVVTITPTPTIVQVSPSPQVQARVLVSPFNATKTLSIAVVAILLGVLVIDGVVTSRKRIARIGGRTFAHISFLGMILAIIIILKAGRVI
jgi:uncharacterized protein YkwD